MGLLKHKCKLSKGVPSSLHPSWQNRPAVKLFSDASSSLGGIEKRYFYLHHTITLLPETKEQEKANIDSDFSNPPFS